MADATEDFFLTPFALAILDATYAFGSALKEAWFKQCGGRAGVCPQLASISNEVQAFELVLPPYTHILQNFLHFEGIPRHFANCRVYLWSQYEDTAKFGRAPSQFEISIFRTSNI